MRTTRRNFFSRALARGRWNAFAALSGIFVSALSLSTLPFFASSAAAATSKIDSTTRQAILDCTFEVVAQMRGGETASRAANAASLVRVAGSASCLGEGQLVTAAHVFDQVLGGRFDVPFVRDRAGHTFPVEKILRYSTQDDFVVFTAAGLTSLPARPHNTTGEFGETLHFGWRRSDGDIAFDSARYLGRSTVATLGRDGWIQFGPAPGHGASGAALLDEAGRVIGLINGRSSENADAQAFAVPVEKLESASTEWAQIAIRDPLRALGMPSERNLPLVGGIPLPASWARFEQHMIEVRKTYFAHTLPYSLALAGVDAPMSDTQRVALCEALDRDYCVDPNEASMTPVRADQSATSRRSRGCDVAWNGVGAALVHCGARDAVAASLAVNNARAEKASMSLGRRFAPVPPAPCTNADPLEGPAATDAFLDHTGAQWQVRAWSMRGCDWVVLSMSRALPDGSLTFIRGAPSAYADAAAMQLKALTAIRREGNSASDGETRDAVLAELSSVQGEVSR